MKRSGPAASARSTASWASGCDAEQAGQAVVGAHVAQPGVDVVADERADGVAEDDRVGDLHHRRLQVHGEEHALGLGVGDLLGEELLQRGAAHDRRVDDLAGQQRHRLLEHRDRAVGGDVLDAHVGRLGDGDRALGGAEVAAVHRRDVGLGIRRPGAHRVRVLAHERLDRRGRAAVGVALAQHRVDGAALDGVVAGADVALLRRWRAPRDSRGSRSPGPAAR